MTPQEIYEAQQEIHDRFPPEVLEFLRRRSKKKNETHQSDHEHNHQGPTEPTPTCMHDDKPPDSAYEKTRYDPSTGEVVQRWDD
jgi:hypothetical protein